jgi:2-dehydro-3-deoxyglucarate aldolase
MSIKKRLNNGEVIIGTWLNSGSPVIGEIFAQCGFDFVCVDVEHSPVGINDCFQIFQSIKSGNNNCASAVRLQEVDYGLTKRYLDAGARVIIGPLVNNAEQAKLLVEATKYPPDGKRGVGFCRANDYGKKVNEEFKSANESLILAVQIEDIIAVNNIDEILAVKGIDVAFIGPYDLSASMGITGDFENPEFVKVKEKVMKACEKHNVSPGIHVVKPDINELLERVSEGYKFLAYSLDITMVQQQSAEMFKKIKNA